MADLPPLPLVCKDKLGKRVFVVTFLGLLTVLLVYAFVSDPTDILLGFLVVVFLFCSVYVVKAYVLLPLTLFTIDDEGIYPHGAAKEHQRKVRWEEVTRLELTHFQAQRQSVPYIAIWLNNDSKFGALGSGGWEETMVKGFMGDGYAANLYISPWICGMKEERFLEILTTLWRQKVPETQTAVT